MDDELFSKNLYEKLAVINPGIRELEMYEFMYALHGVEPVEGWETFTKNHLENLENTSFDLDFFEKIQLKANLNGDKRLDSTILWLTQKLFTSLVTDDLTVGWVKSNFYFDIRAFCFFVRTNYYNEKILTNLGKKPYLSFKPKQLDLEHLQEIGYKDFKKANQEIDQAFIQVLYKLIEIHGSPILLTLAGPTGAGKTEITERINELFQSKNMQVTTIEMDNFFKDREYRDGKAYGKEVIHFDLFIQAIRDLLAGNSTTIPRYDFYKATSSHDHNSNLRPGQSMIKINPADVIFLEGNFPFYIPELDDLITLRTVYLTDDPVRLKRKWRRDIDLRKKYHPIGFINRYFKTQYLRAQEIYLPLMEVCDLVADTTSAKLWLKPKWIEEMQKFDLKKSQYKMVR